MSVLRRLSRDEIKENFTHKGWFMGVVPVYIDDPLSPFPVLATRNWIPDWYMDLVQTILETLPTNNLIYKIAITGEIN